MPRNSAWEALSCQGEQASGGTKRVGSAFHLQGGKRGNIDMLKILETLPVRTRLPLRHGLSPPW